MFSEVSGDQSTPMKSMQPSSAVNTTHGSGTAVGSLPEVDLRSPVVVLHSLAVDLRILVAVDLRNLAGEEVGTSACRSSKAERIPLPSVSFDCCHLLAYEMQLTYPPC